MEVRPTLKLRVGDRHYSDISFVRAKDLTSIVVDIPSRIVIKNKSFNVRSKVLIDLYMNSTKCFYSK